MRTPTFLLSLSLIWVAPAYAQEDHSQHGGAATPAPSTTPPADSPPAAPAADADPHAGHATGAAQGDDGPWSYKGRKNPAPYTENRWEMVPAEGNTATYVNADKLDKDARCAALKRQSVQALDRATRAECGIGQDSRAAESQGKVSATADMNMAGMDHGSMQHGGGGGKAAPAAPQGEMPGMDHSKPGAMDHSPMGGADMDGHWMAPPAAAQRKNPVRADKASIARGKKIFAANCASCHGANGKGDGPAGKTLKPKPSDLAAMAPQHPPGDLAWKIENGRGAMPAWKGTLQPNQIWDVVNFLQALAPAADAGKAGKQADDGHAGHAH